MARLRNQRDSLIDVSKLDAKRTLNRIAHIGCNETGSKSLAFARPLNSQRSGRRAWLDQSLPSEPAQIELKTVLEANSLS
jgi:hypothetical protein